jgi:hypothetical protein
MKRYFDAHLYDSNLGSRVFCLRFPLDCLDEKQILPYLVEGALELTKTDTHLILSFILHTEGDDYEEVDSETILAELLPIRTALMEGDYRALYLQWLSAVAYELVDDDATEPPVPAGLPVANVALETLMEFFHLDPDLVIAAAAHSTEMPASPHRIDFEKWLDSISSNEKQAWLAQFLAGDSPALRRSCLMRFKEKSPSTSRPDRAFRTAAQLRSRATQLQEERIEKERKDAEQKELARIVALAGQEAGLWESVSKLSMSSSTRYKETALHMLKDLRQLASVKGANDEFQEKLNALIAQHRPKSAFMKMIQQAGLATA